MKELWSDDRSVIRQEMEALIAENIPLICARRGAQNLRRLTLNRIVTSGSGEILVVHHSHAPTCEVKSCLFYYQRKKNSLRMIECERVKHVNGLMGFRLPTRIFTLINRKFKRVSTPNNSTANFSIHNKQRIYTGTIDDISIDGAKFLVTIPSVLPKGTIVENLTLSLFCRSRYIEETHLHIPQAKVVWLEYSVETTNVLGVQFLLRGKDHDKLSDYIDLRSMEDSPEK